MEIYKSRHTDKLCVYCYIYIILILILFFFSLLHQRADDEALTRLLQTSLFLVASPILVKSMFFLFRSFLTLYCIVLCLYIYIALLAVHTNQKRFQCERPREKRAVLSE